MAKSGGVDTGFAKCFILFMALVILVQGCLYLALAIWGTTQENCSGSGMDVSGNPLRFALDLIYFIREDCGDVSITNIPGQQNPVILDIQWAESLWVTHRTYIFLISYAVISGLWIIGSLLVIASIWGPMTKLVSAFCFLPWFLFVIAGSILDAIATGYHVYDILHTKNVEKTFAFIGASTSNQDVMTFLQNFDTYFVTPAVVMTCISSRVVLIWLLNIFGTSFCLSLSRVLAVKRESSHHKNHNETRPPPLVIAAAQTQQQQQQQQQQRPERQMSAYSVYTPNAPSLKSDYFALEAIRSQSPPARESSSSNVIADDITYRKTETHPDRLDYPQKTPSQQQQQQQQLPSPAIAAKAQLSTTSILNSRYTGQDPQNHHHSPNRASEELRGQLPWSYTSAAMKPQPPRKPQAYPDVPSPDYNKRSSRENEATAPLPPPTPTTKTVPMKDAGQQQAYSRW